MPTDTPAFRLFGFPVHVRSGFILFMLVVVFINGPEYGLPLALAMAGFTLLHELGHAFAARATGAEAQIALDFLAGYAAFVPTRPLRKWERAGISFAGPAVQVVAGSLLYVLIGGDVSPPIHGLTPLQFAVLWAGPVIGLFNLIPVLPFDGGNIAQVALEVISPKHARQIMYGLTLGIVAGALVLMAVHPQWRPLMIFVLIPFISVLQLIGSDRERNRRATDQASVARAEALAWATGDVRNFPAGRVPSPWYRAWQQLQGGHPDIARDLLVADFTSTEPVNWWPPDAAPAQQLEQLVRLLPRPLPTGRSFSSFVLSNVLLTLGEYDDAGHYAAEAYTTHRSPMLAVHVARAAAALGDRTSALSWLETAARDAHPVALRAAIDRAPEFARLRDDHEFAAAVQRIAPNF